MARRLGRRYLEPMSSAEAELWRGRQPFSASNSRAARLHYLKSESWTKH